VAATPILSRRPGGTALWLDSGTLAWLAKVLLLVLVVLFVVSLVFGGRRRTVV